MISDTLTHRVSPCPDLTALRDQSTSISTSLDVTRSTLLDHFVWQLHLCHLVDIAKLAIAQAELTIGIAACTPDFAILCVQAQ